MQQKPVETIEIIQKSYPISHNDYIGWQIDLSLSKKKTRKQIEEFYKAILKLIEKEDVVCDLLHFRINGLPFTYENIKDLNIKEAIVLLNKAQAVSFENNQATINLQTPLSKPNATTNPNEIPAIISALKVIKSRAEATENPEFFYHQVLISEEEIFQTITDDDGKIYRVIRKDFLPYLRFMNLSDIVFSNVDLRGIDLSQTNVKKIDFTTLYKNSLENTNLEDVDLFFQELHNINIDGANLNGTYLQIDATSVDISAALYDDTVLIHNFNEKGYISICGPKRKRISKLHF